MEELLRSTEAEAVRGRVRAVSSDQVLDLRGVNCDDMLTTLNDMLNPYGITVDRVTIASVHLPRIVTARLQNTTTFQSKQKLQRSAGARAAADVGQAVLPGERERAREPS